MVEVNVVQQRTLRQSWSKRFSTVSRVCLFVAAAVGIAGCTQPTVFHRNPVAVLPMGSFQRDWFVDLQLSQDPIVKVDVRDKLVYLYTRSKQVLAFDRKSGTLQLTLQVNNADVTLKPLVELQDRIVFPSATSLQVFDSSGVFQKEIDLTRPLRSNAAGEGNVIYFGSVGTHGGLVEAFDVAQPYAPQKWEYLTHDGASVTAGIAVYNGTVYSGSEQGEIDAVATDRQQLWDTDNGAFLAGPVAADLKVDEFGLYVASKDTKLSCINRSTGKLKWQYFAGYPLVDSPVTTADSVYQYVPGLGLAALDKTTGPFNRTPRWVHPTATQFLAQDDKYVYLADPRPTADDKGAPGYAIVAVDKQTMRPAFESDHKDFSVFGTNQRDSLIYAGFPDGKFYAVQPVLKAGVIGELVMTPVSSDVAIAK